MTQFGADTEVMQSSATRIGTIHAAIDARLGVLRGQMEMVAGGFVGNAGTTFQTTMADFNQKATAFSRSLDTMDRELKRSGVGATDTDDTGASSLNTALPSTSISQVLG